MTFILIHRKLTVSIVSGPHLAGATIVVNSDGTVTYTSPVCGEDSVVYQICDPAPLCATATIYIYVDCGSITHYPPIAVDDFDSTDYETPVYVPVLRNDYDRNGTGIQITAIPCSPLKGTDSIAGGNIYKSYTPRFECHRFKPRYLLLPDMRHRFPNLVRYG